MEIVGLNIRDNSVCRSKSTQLVVYFNDKFKKSVYFVQKIHIYVHEIQPVLLVLVVTLHQSSLLNTIFQPYLPITDASYLKKIYFIKLNTFYLFV